MTEDDVQLELSRDEALVLLECLARSHEAGSINFEDQAEQRVLWNIEAMLEKKLVEIFDPKYNDLLARARARVRDE
jgi:hypothetical protein